MLDYSLFNGSTLLAVERIVTADGTRLTVLNAGLAPMAENDIVDETTGAIVGEAESLGVIINGQHIAQLMRFHIDGHTDCRLVVNPSANVYLVVLCLN